MKRTWPIIGVADVARSFRWYQMLFGQPAVAPAHEYFGQLCDDDGTVLLCLHRWGDHGHPTLANPDRSEEHTSELQSLMRISYAVFCFKKTNITTTHSETIRTNL